LLNYADRHTHKINIENGEHFFKNDTQLLHYELGVNSTWTKLAAKTTASTQALCWATSESLYKYFVENTKLMEVTCTSIT